MYQRRILIALAAAIAVSGTFTVWLGRRLSHQRSDGASKLRYVAALKSVDPGAVLTPADLTLVSWPESAPLPEAFTRSEDVAGKAVLYPLQQGQPIAARDLSSGMGLSGHIPDGMRAISLKSNEVVGVAGFLLPGTHVDVLVTVRSAAAADPMTSIVLQDVRVLTAGEKMQPDPDGKASRVDVVTLLVSPEDAEKAVLATTQGTVHFVLRNGDDHAITHHTPVSIASLAMPQSTTPPMTTPVAAPRTRAERAIHTIPAAPYTIQIRRGDKDSVETF